LCVRQGLTSRQASGQLRAARRPDQRSFFRTVNCDSLEVAVYCWLRSGTSRHFEMRLAGSPFTTETTRSESIVEIELMGDRFQWRRARRGETCGRGAAIGAAVQAIAKGVYGRSQARFRKVPGMCRTLSILCSVELCMWGAQGASQPWSLTGGRWSRFVFKSGREPSGPSRSASQRRFNVQPAIHEKLSSRPGACD